MRVQRCKLPTMGCWVPRLGLGTNYVSVNVGDDRLTVWNESGDRAVWHEPTGNALAKAVILGECDPGILADWCDENSPTKGRFTDHMGDMLRWEMTTEGATNVGNE